MVPPPLPHFTVEVLALEQQNQADLELKSRPSQSPRASKLPSVSEELASLDLQLHKMLGTSVHALHRLQSSLITIHHLILMKKHCKRSLTMVFTSQTRKQRSSLWDKDWCIPSMAQRCAMCHPMDLLPATLSLISLEKLPSFFLTTL